MKKGNFIWLALVLVFSIASLGYWFLLRSNDSSIPPISQTTETKADSLLTDSAVQDSVISVAVQDSMVEEKVSAKAVVKVKHKANSPVISAPVVATPLPVTNPTPVVSRSPKPQFKGKELKYSSFRIAKGQCTRLRLTVIFETFKEGDFITGKELAKFYKNHPTHSYAVKTLASNFVEKNIKFVERRNDKLLLHTMDTAGVHTNIKIPFVKEYVVIIPDKSALVVGKTFKSNKDKFNPSFMLPLQLENISILDNGKELKDTGYLSGDYFFIDYPNSTLSYLFK
jgi:hypothetical protein